MRKLATVGANLLWFLSTVFSAFQQYRATRKVAHAQREVLFATIKHNQETVFGKEHDFESIANVDDFRRRVPSKPYEGFEPYIQRIANGEISILTAERVKLLEPSSGTSGGKKLIPYTSSLQGEFQAGINPWINRLYRTRPRMFLGRAYWSVAPLIGKEFTSGGIPIGFSTDAEYLGAFQQAAVNAIMAVPKEVSLLQDVETFRYVSALFLLVCRDLALISVWHPSFLTLLFQTLEKCSEQLINDVRSGHISASQLPPEIRNVLESKLRPNPRRARELERLFSNWRGKQSVSQNDRGKTLYEEVWPNLCVVSCWGDAQARHFFHHLRAYFPNTYCEPKGLLATEGFISYPLSDTRGSVLSLRSHFFEFCEVNDATESHTTVLAHELQVGHRYSVILTTSGGLYRYELGDIVEVLGFEAQCPIISFVGKQSSVVDVCGEKLTEIEVGEAAQRVFTKFGTPPNFWMLVPEIDPSNSVGYTLFFQPATGTSFPPALAQEVARQIDAELDRNFYYAYCRKLGQLQPIRAFVIDPMSNPIGQYLDTCQRLGQRLGNIKPKVLHGNKDWGNVFVGVHV